MGDILRRAWHHHVTSPLRPCCQRNGIAWCPEAMALFHLLPRQDQLAILATVS